MEPAIFNAYMTNDSNPRSIENQGRLLQIFVKKTEINKFVYKSQPGGVPLSNLEDEFGNCIVNEQVRIIAKPEYFINTDMVKTYLYHGNHLNIQNRIDFISKTKEFLNYLFPKNDTELEQRNIAHIKQIIGINM